MPRLPSRNADLARTVRRGRALRLLLFAGWVAILTLAAVFFNNSHRGSVLPLIVGWRMWVWVAFALLSGALLFRFFSLFSDKAFEGEIIRSSLAHTYAASEDEKNADETANFRVQTVLRVRCTDGKIRKLRFEQKPGFFLYYHEGNRVCKFAGLRYPLADPESLPAPPRPQKTADEDTTGKTIADLSRFSVCVFCGHFYPTPTVCENCGHSLIDPNEVFPKEK